MVLAVANYLPSLLSLPPLSPRTPSFALATLRTPVQVRAVLANSSTNRPSHTHQFILGTVLFPSNVLRRAYYTLLSGSKHPHPDERESTGVRYLEHHGHFRAMIALNASTSPISYQYACGIFHPVRKRQHHIIVSDQVLSRTLYHQHLLRLLPYRVISPMGPEKSNVTANPLIFGPLEKTLNSGVHSRPRYVFDDTCYSNWDPLQTFADWLKER